MRRLLKFIVSVCIRLNTSLQYLIYDALTKHSVIVDSESLSGGEMSTLCVCVCISPSDCDDSDDDDGMPCRSVSMPQFSNGLIRSAVR